MKDRVFESFLTRQFQEGMALAEVSDILNLVPVSGDPPNRYIAEFNCRGFARRNGRIVEHDEFRVGVWFPSDYLRRASAFEVLTWLDPLDVFHPNIGNEGLWICIGRMVPGTSLVDLLYQVFEIVTYQKVTMREDDALNPEACGWARENQHLFPVDARPLKRRALELIIEPVRVEA